MFLRVMNVTDDELIISELKTIVTQSKLVKFNNNTDGV